MKLETPSLKHVLEDGMKSPSPVGPSALRAFVESPIIQSSDRWLMAHQARYILVEYTAFNVLEKSNPISQPDD